MGRILALDYGRKRTGVAVTDPLKIIASSLPTLETGEVLPFLKSYHLENSIERIVIGEPRQMNNAASESMVFIEAFLKELKVSLPDIPVSLVDERFTSKLAVQAMVMGGVKKKDRQDKARIDQVSAVIILQSYLESKEYQDTK